MSTVSVFDNLSTQVKRPARFAHVVLRTNNLPVMQEFYINFLGAHLVYANSQVAFITYDDEHHRIALITPPGTGDKVHNSSGLEHIAYTFDTITDLLIAYRQRRANGVTPAWCVNHGPTTSMYYHDPDGNTIESQVDNMPTPDEATAFMKTAVFAENPFGADFDPEEWIRRLENGEDEEKLKKRIEVGPRTLDSVPIA